MIISLSYKRRFLSILVGAYHKRWRYKLVAKIEPIASRFVVRVFTVIETEIEIDIHTKQE